MKTKFLFASLLALIPVWASALTLTWVSHPTSASSGQSYTYSATGSGSGIMYVELYKDGAYLGSVSSGTISTTQSDTGPASIQYFAAAESYFDEYRSLTSTITISAPTNTAPTGVFDWAASTVTKGQNLSASGWAADNEMGAPVARVEVKIDGVDVADAALGGDRPDVASYFGRSDYQFSGWTAAVGTGSLTPGAHSIETIAWDTQGLSYYMGSRSFTVTNAAPTVTLTSPSAQTITLGAALTLAAHATDSDGNIVTHNIDIQRPDGSWNWQGGFANGEPYMGGPVGSAADSTRSASFTFNQVGLWHVRSWVNDANSNNNYSATVEITVNPPPDTTPPTLSATPPTASAITSNSFTLSWPAATDNVGVTGYEVRIGTAPPLSPGTSATFMNIAGLTANTTYAMSMHARDAEGNWSAWSTAVNVTTALGVPSTPTLGVIEAGDSNSVALRSDGTVWGWGYNPNGQLGDGTTTQRSAPVQVSGLSEVVAISAGGSHVVALKSDGTVWAWGYNGNGQLGDGTTTQRTAPVQVSGLGSVVAIAGGGSHTVALKGDGTVWAWGANSNGQLGDGTTTQRTAPVQVSGLGGVVKLAKARTHSVVLKNDGTVWAWGANSNGQLGDGTTTQRTAPVQVSGLGGVLAVAGGTAYTVALKSDGTVWAWGSNSKGQLGDGTTIQRAAPVQVSGLSGVLAVSASNSMMFSPHTVAVKNDGTVWAWGYNFNGQLGDGTTTQRTVPGQVSGLSGVMMVAAGNYHTLALKNDGSVRAWGSNANGQLGDGTTTQRTAPVQVSVLTGVLATVVGNSHSVALKSDGTVWTWGANSNGQLGDGTTTTRTSPVQVSGLGSVLAAAAGSSHTAVLKSDGTVWTWGLNDKGQLGDGTTTQRTTPVQVSGLVGVQAVDAGNAHTATLKSDGTVWTWGLNDKGQLGDGTTTQRTTPVQVSGLVGVQAVDAGNAHMVVLKSDGTVWTWGANSSGQLGDGTTTQRSSPVQVSGLGSVLAVSAGGSHTVTVKSDGTVWAWGLNSSGQLGDGTTTLRSSPLQVSGLGSVLAVSAGGSHTVAVKSDGTVWAWGLNSSGQLGDGTTTQRTNPVQVIGLSGVLKVVAGSGYTMALKSDGTLRGWGSNSTSQLAYTDNPGPQTQAAIGLKSSSDDTNQNAISDAWEMQYFGNLNHTGGTDSDGDGLTDIQEFAKGSNPILADADADLLTDFVDPYPNDYFNNVAPFLNILGGNNQTTSAGQFNALPFDIAVSNSSGSILFVNAPVTFSVQTGGGLLATTNLGTPPLASPLDLRSATDGTVKAYYKVPSGSSAPSQIRVVAGPTQINLATNSSFVDSDGNGLLDSWEMQYFGQLGNSPTADPDSDGLTNLQESNLGLNPNNSNTDADALPDGVEVEFASNASVAANADPAADTAGSVIQLKIQRPF